MSIAVRMTGTRVQIGPRFDSDNQYIRKVAAGADFVMIQGPTASFISMQPSTDSAHVKFRYRAGAYVIGDTSVTVTNTTHNVTADS